MKINIIKVASITSIEKATRNIYTVLKRNKWYFMLLKLKQKDKILKPNIHNLQFKTNK